MPDDFPATGATAPNEADAEAFVRRALGFAIEAGGLSQAETDVLVQVAGQRASTSGASEWSTRETRDATDALLHDGLICHQATGTLGVSDTVAEAALRRAHQAYDARRERLADQRRAIHRAIRERMTEPYAVLGESAFIEDEYREVLRPHRRIVSLFPDIPASWDDIDAINEEAIASVRRAAPFLEETDVVDTHRMRLPIEADFFGRVAAFGHMRVATVPDVPLRLTLLDERVAVIPADPDHHPRRAWVVTDPDAVAQVALQIVGHATRATPVVPQRAPELSEREATVVTLLGQGHTDEAIARRLHVADRTVRRVVSDLMHRMGADSRFALAVECARRGLV